jgi:hypothetical protein
MKPMARYTASIQTPRSPDETFAYLSDFSTTQEWDPGVEAQRVGDGPIGEGTRFRVVADFLGRKATLTYRIVEFVPGQAVTLRGENATVVSLDRMTFAPAGEGTRVYDADLALKGLLRIADPLLGLAFRAGQRAWSRASSASSTRWGARRPRRSSSTSRAASGPRPRRSTVEAPVSGSAPQ